MCVLYVGGLTATDISIEAIVFYIRYWMRLKAKTLGDEAPDHTVVLREVRKLFDFDAKSAVVRGRKPRSKPLSSKTRAIKRIELDYVFEVLQVKHLLKKKQHLEQSLIGLVYAVFGESHNVNPPELEPFRNMYEYLKGISKDFDLDPLSEKLLAGYHATFEGTTTAAVEDQCTICYETIPWDNCKDARCINGHYFGALHDSSVKVAVLTVYSPVQAHIPRDPRAPYIQVLWRLSTTISLREAHTWRLIGRKDGSCRNWSPRC
jgi:hypothetical protein